MASRKYANYIIKGVPRIVTRTKGGPQLKKKGGPKLNQILMMNGDIVKGAFHVNCAWISPGPNPGVFDAHVHPHDEIIGFIGTNPQDPNDLGGKAELWIDDEKYIISRSFLAYFPKGLKHCPLTVTNVQRPIFHFDIQIAKGRPEFKWIIDLPRKK
jgi:hypothetical protein